MKIAIIGAGLSGTHMYHLLSQNIEYEITVFEKSRGTGGRCSTRFLDDKKIDYGTPFFTTDNSYFKALCQRYIDNDILKIENSKYLPIDGINKICSSLIDTDNLITETKITKLEKINNLWIIYDEHNKSCGEFDRVILTIPAAQILELDLELEKQLTTLLKCVTYDSIGTLMAYSHSFENIMNPKLLANEKFSKIIDNSLKYGYDNFSSYVLYLDSSITKEQNFKNKKEIQDFIVKTVEDISGIDLKEDFHLIPHFWKYALVKNSIRKDYLLNNDNSLAIIGDYFNGSNLEASIKSSTALYEQNFNLKVQDEL
jgi:predicted NAD/FAD-dependent oxidoreductase